MDVERFEQLTRALARRGSRRRALAFGAGVGAAAVAGGRPARAASTCEWRFEAGVLSGEMASRAIYGSLSVTVAADGAVDRAELTVETGAEFEPVVFAGVGQADGTGIVLRLVAGACQAIVLTGNADGAIDSCDVRLDGLMRGAALDEVGSWRAWPLDICPPTEQFLPDDCTCAIVGSQCARVACAEGQTWDEAACSCSGDPDVAQVCGNVLAGCPDPKVFDPEQCVCVCPPWDCKANQALNPETCLCENLPCDLECEPGFTLEPVTCECRCDPFDCDEGTWDGRDCECLYPQCPAGQIQCGGECVPKATSRAHCGRCGKSCAEGQMCKYGVCI
jgi:hypothetical protein